MSNATLSPLDTETRKIISEYRSLCEFDLSRYMMKLNNVQYLINCDNIHTLVTEDEYVKLLRRRKELLDTIEELKIKLSVWITAEEACLTVIENQLDF